MSESLRLAADHLYEASCLFEIEDLDPQDALAVVQACFTRSDCDDFAFVVGEITGWPAVKLVWVDREGDVAHHALVRTPEGRLFDVMGFVEIPDLRRRYRIPSRSTVAIVENHPHEPFVTGDPVEDFERVASILPELPYEPFQEIVRTLDVQAAVLRFENGSGDGLARG